VQQRFDFPGYRVASNAVFNLDTLGIEHGARLPDCGGVFNVQFHD